MLYKQLTAAFDTGSKVLIEEMSPGVEPILILLSSVFRDEKIEYDLDLLKSIQPIHFQRVSILPLTTKGACIA